MADAEERRGLPENQRTEFWKKVLTRHNYYVKKYPKILNKSCAFFVIIALQEYLRAPMNVRKLLHYFYEGTWMPVVNKVIVDSGLSLYYLYDFGGLDQIEENLRPLDKKNIIDDIIPLMSSHGYCAYLKVRMNREGQEPLYHAIGFLPVKLEEGGFGYYLFDCNGDFEEAFLNDSVDVLYVALITDPPFEMPKELEGGRRKTKKNHTFKKKTHGRRI